MSYLPQEGTLSIIVFKNDRRTTEKQPTHTVIVTQPDGTKYEGGLFVKTGKNGSTFHTGTLKLPQQQGEYNRAPRPAPAPNTVEVDF